MRYILDTHALLWFTGGNKRLSTKAKYWIENTDNKVMTSTVSLFDISMNIKIGKPILVKPLAEIYRDIQPATIEIVPVLLSHLGEYQNIPLYTDHRDPLDRLLITILVVEKADTITVEPKFQYYIDLVKIVW